MLEEIDFQDSGNQVSVTIDNETQSLPIKKINKLSTYIGLNQSLNTALENNIEVILITAASFVCADKQTETKNWKLVSANKKPISLGYILSRISKAFIKWIVTQ